MTEVIQRPQSQALPGGPGSRTGCPFASNAAIGVAPSMAKVVPPAVKPRKVPSESLITLTGASGSCGDGPRTTIGCSNRTSMHSRQGGMPSSAAARLPAAQTTALPAIASDAARRRQSILRISPRVPISSRATLLATLLLRPFSRSEFDAAVGAGLRAKAATLTYRDSIINFCRIFTMIAESAETSELA